MDEKKFSLLDILQVVLIVALIVTIFKGGSGTSNTSVSHGSGEAFKRLADMLYTVMPYVFAFAMSVMLGVLAYEIYYDWKTSNITIKQVIIRVMIWVGLTIFAYFMYVAISNMGDTLYDRLPAMINLRM
jgi:amino acid permease